MRESLLPSRSFPRRSTSVLGERLVGIFFTVLCGLSLAACSTDEQLIGTWVDAAHSQTFTFAHDGKFTREFDGSPASGTWTADGRLLRLSYPDGALGGYPYEVREPNLALDVRTRATDGGDVAGEWILRGQGNEVEHWKLDPNGAADLWNDYSGLHDYGQWTQPAPDRVTVTWSEGPIDQNEPPSTFRAESQRLDGHTLTDALLARVR